MIKKYLCIETKEDAYEYLIKFSFMAGIMAYVIVLSIYQYQVSLETVCQNKTGLQEFTTCSSPSDFKVVRSGGWGDCTGHTIIDCDSVNKK